MIQNNVPHKLHIFASVPTITNYEKQYSQAIITQLEQ